MFTWVGTQFDNILGTYVLAVAPPMSAHEPPVASQRRHWYVYVCGCPPVHVPWFAVRVWPCCGVPEIVGGLAFAGGPAVDEGWTTPAVALEFALAVPSTFDAITRERIRCPTSAARSTSVDLVAPGTVEQLTPFGPPPLVSHRSQR